MKNKRTILETVQQIENEIRSYNLVLARELIEAIDVKEITDSLRPKVASLAKRLNLPDLGIKILYSLVYEKPGLDEKTILEFASCLRKAGLSRQAFLWLKKIAPTTEALRELAFVHITLWEYGEARDILNRLLSQYETEDAHHAALIKTNLAACYVYLEELDKAFPLIQDIEAHKGYGNQQLYLNAVEMHAQCLMQKQRPQAAIQKLENVLSSIDSPNGLTHLFLMKWKYLAHLAEGSDEADLDVELKKVQTLARQSKHWETLRDTDYRRALIEKDIDLIAKVLFGTPHPSYKDRVIKTFGFSSVPTSYIWHASKIGGSLNVFDSYFEGGGILGMGQLEHRLLLLLLSDFYSPFSTAKIFDELHQGELYDPYTSSNRVHTLVKSLRNSLSGLPMPIELPSTVAGYRLRPQDGIAFRTYYRMNFKSINDFYSFLIQSLFKTGSFTRGQFESSFRLSSAQGQRRIRELVDEGLLKKEGSGPATHYRFNLSRN